MGKDNDREHFEEYRDQTRAKHEILAAYLKPYFQIVGSTNSELSYVDGFSGPGTYTDAESGQVFDGSPLRALKLIAGNETFARKVSTVFIEVDDYLFYPLKAAVDAFANSNPQIRKPRTECCTFAEGVEKLLHEASGKLAPTFLFVDPCGVSGTSFATIKSVMACKSSEAFIFFNIDGVRRIAGLPKVSEVLVELLGSKERAQSLFASFQKTDDVSERERMILHSYRQSLRDDMGVIYSIPFRVESEERQKTSHYLIHATKNKHGFAIMKDVMWRYGHSENMAGGLEFEQASRTNYLSLFDFRGDIVKAAILGTLDGGPAKVAMFYEDWVWRPENMLCATAYKQALLELEASGAIEVVTKDGKLAAAADRRKHKGKPTLGKDHYVRVAQKSKP